MPRNWVGRLVDERPLLGWPVLVVAFLGVMGGMALIAAAIAMGAWLILAPIAWAGTWLFGEGFVSAVVWMGLGILLAAALSQYWQRLRPP